MREVREAGWRFKKNEQKKPKNNASMLIPSSFNPPQANLTTRAENVDWTHPSHAAAEDIAQKCTFCHCMRKRPCMHFQMFVACGKVCSFDFRRGVGSCKEVESQNANQFDHGEGSTGSAGLVFTGFMCSFSFGNAEYQHYPPYFQCRGCCNTFRKQ